MPLSFDLEQGIKLKRLDYENSPHVLGYFRSVNFTPLTSLIAEKKKKKEKEAHREYNNVGFYSEVIHNPEIPFIEIKLCESSEVFLSGM